MPIRLKPCANNIRRFECNDSDYSAGAEQDGLWVLVRDDVSRTTARIILPWPAILAAHEAVLKARRTKGE